MDNHITNCTQNVATEQEITNMIERLIKVLNQNAIEFVAFEDIPPFNVEQKNEH